MHVHRVHMHTHQQWETSYTNISYTTLPTQAHHTNIHTTYSQYTHYTHTFTSTCHTSPQTQIHTSYAITHHTHIFISHTPLTHIYTTFSHNSKVTAGKVITLNAIENLK